MVVLKVYGCTPHVIVLAGSKHLSIYYCRMHAQRTDCLHEGFLIQFIAACVLFVASGLGGGGGLGFGSTGFVYSDGDFILDRSNSLY